MKLLITRVCIFSVASLYVVLKIKICHLGCYHSIILFVGWKFTNKVLLGIPFSSSLVDEYMLWFICFFLFNLLPLFQIKEFSFQVAKLGHLVLCKNLLDILQTYTYLSSFMHVYGLVAVLLGIYISSGCKLNKLSSFILSFFEDGMLLGSFFSNVEFVFHSPYSMTGWKSGVVARKEVTISVCF